MGIAMLSAARLVQVMPLWVDWVKSGSAAVTGHRPPSCAEKTADANRYGSGAVRKAGGLWARLLMRRRTDVHVRVAPASVRAPGQQAPLRPLRVLRVLEPQQPRAAAGRMVISGSMADVCAELDRLAALEAKASNR